MKTLLLLSLLAGVAVCQPQPKAQTRRSKPKKGALSDQRFDFPVARDTSGVTDAADVKVPAKNWDAVNDVPLFATNGVEGAQQIINGQDSVYGDHPYTCSLQELYRGFWYFVCGSVIYNENTVMTAAHCIRGVEASNLRVVCGDYDLRNADSAQVTKSISATKSHPRYRENGSRGFPNDIAVMRVETPLVFNNFVNTIPIATSTTTLPRQCTLIGWGVTESGSLSNILQDVDIRRLTKGQCRRVWGRRAINNGHICFRNQGSIESSCNGDSGGPAVCGDYLVGLTSWGARDCEAGYPSVYTRLSTFSTWLNNNSY